jgi:acyl-CoA synthetase
VRNGVRLSDSRKTRDYIEKGWWGTETLADLFASNVANNPHGLAAVDPPNREEIDGCSPRRLSYLALHNDVEQAIGRFATLGLCKGDVVAFQLPNTIEQIVYYLACIRAGLIISPLPIQWREHELLDILPFVGAKAIITATTIRGFDQAELLVSLSSDLHALENVLVLGSAAPEGAIALDTVEAKAHELVPLHVSDAVTICWTSGTEARPKGVPRHHNHWIVAGIASVDAAKLEDGCTILNPFPFINMAAIGGTFVPWLLTGGTLVQHHPFDLPVFLGQIANEKVNYTVAPPALLTMLLKDEKLLSQLDLRSLKTMGSGSAPLPPYMVKTWQEDFGLPVINIFGSNEGTCLFSGVDDVPDPEERARFFPRFGVTDLEWPVRVATRIESKLVDLVTGDEITVPGEPGELLLKGATIFEGYFRSGEPDGPTDPFDEEGFFHTGDVFQIAGSDNCFYQFVERAKDIIIRGGMNISPTELDVLLTAHPDVAEGAVVGISDALMGERVCAVIVPQSDAEISLEKLTAYLKEQAIAVYKLPEKLVIVEALPRNPLGKVVRRELADMIVP